MAHCHHATVKYGKFNVKFRLHSVSLLIGATQIKCQTQRAFMSYIS